MEPWRTGLKLEPETKMVSLKATFWTIQIQGSNEFRSLHRKAKQNHENATVSNRKFLFGPASLQVSKHFQTCQICQICPICQVSGQLLTILLFFSIFLSSRAQWRICLEVTAGELRQLLGPPHGGGVVVPKTRHPVLSRVFGKELTELRGRRPLPVDQPKMWGEETGKRWKIMGNGWKWWVDFKQLFLKKSYICWTGYFCLCFLDVFGCFWWFL